ncbi:MAG: hypothetical protein ABII76_02705 [Pseudomonadota bacterium]
MSRDRIIDAYDEERFRDEASRILKMVSVAPTLDDARELLAAHVSAEQFDANQSLATVNGSTLHVVRDCGRALRGMLSRRAEERAGFSVAQAIWDLAQGRPRTDLSGGFFAEMTQLVAGLEGRFSASPPPRYVGETSQGREAALLRSDELDALWARVEMVMGRYADGMQEQSVARRSARREGIVAGLGARPEDFDDWRWQVAHIARDAAALDAMVRLEGSEREAIDLARQGKLPFGVTPYYASLMDEEPDSDRDRALRAQVIPPLDYVEQMLASRGDRGCSFDFMLEKDTSPIDLITRRYPAIVILKPFNTCPQICVYCQRNWEIEEAMAEGAMASAKSIENAIRFIEDHSAIKEVLVTGAIPWRCRTASCWRY